MVTDVTMQAYTAFLTISSDTVIGKWTYPYDQPSIAWKITAPINQKEMSDIALQMRSNIWLILSSAHSFVGAIKREEGPTKPLSCLSHVPTSFPPLTSL